MHTRLAHEVENVGVALPLLPPGHQTLEALVRMLASGEPPWSWLAGRVRFDRDGYLRTPLLERPGLEVLLLTWLPGQATPVHAHGGSVGAVRLLVGALEERRFVATADGFVERTRQVHRAPAVLREGRATVHAMTAVGRRPVVSIHVYSPPLPGDPRSA